MTSEPSGHPESTIQTARKWTGSDLVLGTALVVVAISLFLPWFTASVRYGLPAVSATLDGPAAHGYLWIALVLVIAALAVLVARESIASLPGNLPSTSQMLVGATGLAFLLTVLGALTKPPAYATFRSPGPTASIIFTTPSAGWSYGGLVTVLAAAVALATALAMSGLLQTARRRRAPAADGGDQPGAAP